MKIPTKITPCPIIEAIIEIRFDSDLPPEAVFGVFYNIFKTQYERIEKLPILQLPEALRLKDPNLVFQPHYKLHDNNFILQLGPKVLSLANANTYVGWDKLSEKIKEIFKSVDSLKILKKINRLGIRYINFFELNIFEKINLVLSFSNQPWEAHQTTFKSTLVKNGYSTNIQILNNATVHTSNQRKNGSVIDIDTYFEDKQETDILSNKNDLIEKAHKEEKRLFFSLLKEDFMNSFKIEY